MPVSIDSVAKGRGVNWLAEGKTRADKIFICLVPLTLLMAKRSSSKKASKHYPVQRKIRLGTPQPSQPHTEALIRVDKVASQVNHRLMRQSRVYSVKIDIDTDLPDGSVVDVYAIADTWYNHKAYNMAKAVFDDNSKEEIAQLGKDVARWNDFRVDAEPSGSFHDLDAVQFSAGATSGFFGLGSEYLMSAVHDAAGVLKEFSWTTVGTKFNIIDEYDLTGNTDQSPTFGQNQVGYDGLDDSLDDGQMTVMSEYGNKPPYNPTGLENECWVRVATLVVRHNGGSKLTSGYFDAPCGLVRLSYSGGLTAVTANENICVELKSGDYKGCHAPSYLE